MNLAPERITDFPSLEALRTDWQALSARIPENTDFFATWDYTWTYLNGHRPANWQEVVIRNSKTGTLVEVFPLQVFQVAHAGHGFPSSPKRSRTHLILGFGWNEPLSSVGACYADDQHVLRDTGGNACSRYRKAPSSAYSFRYNDFKAVLKIPDGELLEGDLPKRQMKLVQAWVELHQDDLIADWHLASTGQTPFKIDPLR